jgi:hypothetical protein
MPGISLVSQYLRATLQDNPKHPKIFISVKCEKLIRSLENYQFMEITNRTDLDQPDKPRKKDDHLPDALRYMMTARPRYLSDTWRDNEEIEMENNFARYGYERSKALADRTHNRDYSKRDPRTGRPKILGFS